MNELIIPSIAFIFYLLAAGCQLSRVISFLNYSQSVLLSLAWLAIMIHGGLLYHWIDSEIGQNLSLFNVISQVAWLMALFTTLALYFLPLDNLALIIYPFNALSILLAIFFPGHRIIDIQNNPAQLVHVLLFLFSLSIFFIASFQAFILSIQHYFLKHPARFFLLQTLPSLEQMERLLFQMILWGFIFLTILMLTSFISFDNYLQTHLEHVTLAVFAWIVYFVLLVGHSRFAWRGKRAVSLTLAGFVLLVLCYAVIHFHFSGISK